MSDDYPTHGKHELHHTYAAESHSHNPHAERQNPDTDVDRSGDSDEGKQQRNPYRRAHNGKNPEQRIAAPARSCNRTRNNGQLVERGPR